MNIRTVLLLLVALVAMAGIGWPGDAIAQTPADTAPRARHVIVIGVDGLSPDGVRTAETPNMREMMAKGAWSLNARSVLPTSSSANWASMLGGAGPAQHGVINNDWRVGEFSFPTSVAGSGNFFPSIFQILADQHPDWEVGSVYHWEGFGNLYDRRFVDYDAHGETEAETARLAADYIRARRPNFLFVHLDDVDHVGHAQGHGTAQYYAAVARADAHIGLIRQAVVDAGIMDQTVILVTSDHGGVGKGHGGATLAELEIPWIAYGKGVKPGFRLELPINTFDTPATAAWLLGAEIPYAWLGRPIRPILAGEPMPAQPYRISSFYAAPVIAPEAVGNAPAGGLFMGGPVQMTIRNPNKVGEIRYTLDASIPTSQSALYKGPVPITRSTIVRATLFVDGQAASVPETGYFRILDRDAGARGLRYSAYLLPEMPVRLPDFSRLEAVASGIVQEISIDNLKLPREHAIGVVFEGYLDIAAAGAYAFSLASDDGSKLYIGGKTVVDNDGDHGVITASGSIRLEPGRHPIRVEYFNGGGGSWLGAWFEGPGIARQFVDPNLLSPQ